MEIKNGDSNLSFSEVAVSACLHACVQTRALCFTYATCKFHICIFFPQSFLLTLTSVLLPPCRSDARLQLPQPPSCSPKRRSLASRSPLRLTLSIVYTLTLTSRSRSSSGCRGNGSRSSKTRQKGPNPSSM